MQATNKTAESNFTNVSDGDYLRGLESKYREQGGTRSIRFPLRTDEVIEIFTTLDYTPTEDIIRQLLASNGGMPTDWRIGDFRRLHGLLTQGFYFKPFPSLWDSLKPSGRVASEAGMYLRRMPNPAEHAKAILGIKPAELLCLLAAATVNDDQLTLLQAALLRFGLLPEGQ